MVAADSFHEGSSLNLTSIGDDEEYLKKSIFKCKI